MSERLDEAREALVIVNEWRSLRMEFNALTATVQQRFSDLGRPPGFSAWNEDERKRHLWLLGQMLTKLNALEAAPLDIPAILSALDGHAAALASARAEGAAEGWNAALEEAAAAMEREGDYGWRGRVDTIMALAREVRT